jgi:hypothetical protein
VGEPEPETELYCWGREEELDEPVLAWKVTLSGCVVYWVAAIGPQQALDLIADIDDCLTSGDVQEVHAVQSDLAQMNDTYLYDEELGTDKTMAAEFNRDPSPRVIACSEW